MDEYRIRAELAELEKQALSQTTQPTCLQTISSKAAPLSAAVTELSRHMLATEASTIQAALDGLLSLIAQAAEKASRAEAEGSATCVWDFDDDDLDLDTPDDVLLETLKRSSDSDAQEMLRTVRRRMRAKQSANKATLDPEAEGAAAIARLRQGQRAEELERLFDDAGADIIALQEHRLQTTGQRCGGLFQQVYFGASSHGNSGVVLWFRRSRFKQFELTANAVGPRILSVCMTSTTQCFRFVVAHSPHSGQAAVQVAVDSFYTELLSVTSPQTPDERVLPMGDVNAMVGSVRSEAIGGVGAESESKSGSRFRDFLDGTSMCAINTFVGDGS